MRGKDEQQLDVFSYVIPGQHSYVEPSCLRSLLASPHIMLSFASRFPDQPFVSS